MLVLIYAPVHLPVPLVPAFVPLFKLFLDLPLYCLQLLEEHHLARVFRHELYL